MQGTTYTISGSISRESYPSSQGCCRCLTWSSDFFDGSSLGTKCSSAQISDTNCYLVGFFRLVLRSLRSLLGYFFPPFPCAPFFLFFPFLSIHMFIPFRLCFCCFFTLAFLVVLLFSFSMHSIWCVWLAFMFLPRFHCVRCCMAKSHLPACAMCIYVS